jgi:hypothetical protein
MRKELRERNIRSLLKIEFGVDFIYWKSPTALLTLELTIYEKRDGTAPPYGRKRFEFFINNIGHIGFRILTEDPQNRQIFGQYRVVLKTHLTSFGNNTTALLVLPLAALRKKVEMAQ